LAGGMENLAAVWRDLFTSADGLGPTASAEEKRGRGRQFERILLGMLAEAGLEPRIRFRPVGEEIDGSFFHRGRVLLLEAKWTGDPQPASSIYQFRGKVDGKLVGTIGVFTSMTGYSKDAVDALIGGKVLNIILFNDDDMRAIDEGQTGFAEALDRKLRDAAEAGTPFSPLRDPASGRTLDRLYGSGGPRAVIVEGPFDAALVHALADVLGESSYQLQVAPAGGMSNLAALASAANSAGWADSALIIADGDGHPDLASRSPGLPQQTDIVVLDPSFEEALGIEDASPETRRGLERDRRLLRDKVRAAGVRQAAGLNRDLRQLLRGLGLD
jgi:hypothetical protein